MLQFVVDSQLCTRCGECVLDCPARIIDMVGDALPAIEPKDEAECMRCQHCLTVCPPGAVSILGHDPRRSVALSVDTLPSLDQVSVLVRGRRSVRRYDGYDVDRALLARLLADAANCPTGVNQRELTFSLLDERAAMFRFREQAIGAIVAADAEGRLPESAAYLRRVARVYEHEGRDILFRNAPHALIVSAPPDASCPEQDVVIALAYFELLAQAAGLGTVWWGMLKWLLETVPDLKAVLGIPAGHHYYGMLFGVPSYRYARTAQRDDAAVIRRIVL